MQSDKYKEVLKLYLYPTEQGEGLNRQRLDSSPLGLSRIKSFLLFGRGNPFSVH